MTVVLQRARPATVARPARAVSGSVGAAVLLLFSVALSLALGSRDLGIGAVWQALVHPTAGSIEEHIVRDLRLPRTIMGLVAGAALGAVGVVVQGMTRNPMADPGLLSINQGAALAVVVALWTGVTSSAFGAVWFAFAGAAVAAAVVFTLGRGQPVRLTLTGAALTAFLTPLITLILLRDSQVFGEFRFWTVGSLTGRGLDTLAQLWPFLLVGLVTAAALAPRMNVLALGEDMAVALGQRPAVTRVLAGVAIVLLAACATCLVGPIALVGLVAAHAGRLLVGTDHRLLVPVAALLGPAVLLLADTAGRLIAPPGEVEAGILTAALGAPVLIAVARSKRLAGP